MLATCEAVGEIDKATAPAFSADLRDAIDRSDEAIVSVDCSGVTFRHFESLSGAIHEGKQASRSRVGDHRSRRQRPDRLAKRWCDTAKFKLGHYAEPRTRTHNCSRHKSASVEYRSTDMAGVPVSRDRRIADERGAENPSRKAFSMVLGDAPSVVGRDEDYRLFRGRSRLHHIGSVAIADFGKSGTR